jgi:hypothetical protein
MEALSLKIGLSFWSFYELLIRKKEKRKAAMMHQR